MITCPNCRQTLPDFVNQCQFCGADTRAVQRPAFQPVDDDGFDQPDLRTGSGLSGEWVRRIYYGLGTMWIVTGVWGLLDITLIGPAASKKPFEMSLLTGLIIGITCIRLVLAVGYMMRANIAKQIINVFAAIGLLFALLGLVGSLMTIMLVGPLGVVFVILQLIDVIVNGGIMWIIGESERPDVFP